MKSGKAHDLAIAYNVQRQARKKKMAEGGKVTPNQQEYMTVEEQNKALREDKPLSTLYNPKPKPSSNPRMYAEGGEVDERALSIADAILRKRRMANGGMVDIQDNGDEEGSSPYDTLNADAAKKELYDDDQLSDQPEDSNLMADDVDADDNDRISMIRRKMKAKGA